MKSLIRLKLIRVLCIALFSIGIHLAPICATEQAYLSLMDLTLEELLTVKVSSVSRKYESQAETPGIVTVISHEQFKQLGLKNVNEALMLVPGYQVSFNPRKPTVYVRGNPESALVLIDGVPIVSPLDHEIFLDSSISIDIIDRIEVIRGAGGVLWGATAYVGIINIITFDPSKVQNSAYISTDVASLGDSNLDSTRVNVNYQRKFEEGSIWFNASETRSKDFALQGDNLRSPITGHWNDGYSNENRRKEGFFKEYFLKLKYKNFTLTSRYADEKDFYQIDFRGRTTAKGFDFEEDDPVKQLLVLDYNKSYENVAFHSRLSTMQRTGFLTLGSSFDSHPDGNIQLIFEPWQVRQNNVQLELSSNKIINNNYTTTGFSFVDQYGSDIWGRHIVKDFSGGVEGIAVDPVWFEENKWVTHQKIVESGPGETIYSFFVNSTQNLTDKLSISGGYRYDDNSAYRPVHHFSFNSVYQFYSQHYLKLIYNEGFRPADWEQKNSTTLGGGELEPEESTTLDLQYNATLSKNTTFFVNLSRTTTYNLIALEALVNPVSSDIQYTNNGKRTIKSIEIGTNQIFGNKKGYWFANYSHSVLDDAKLGKITDIADFSANFGLFWKFKDNFSSTLVAHFEGDKKQDMHPIGYAGDEILTAEELVPRKIKGFNVINWGLNFSQNKIESSFFVYNLFDTNYTSGSIANRAREELPNPGRNFAINFTYHF